MKRRNVAVKDRDVFPFDFKHYLATTGHLSTKAHGANLALSLFYLREGELPKEDHIKRHIAGFYEPNDEWPPIAAELTAPVEHPFAFVFKPDWSHPYVDRLREVKRVSCRFNAEALHSLCVRRAFGADWQDIRSRIFARDDYTCAYCGTRGGALECDHIIPVARGGSNEDANLATACKPCNRAKSSMTLEEWKARA